MLVQHHHRFGDAIPALPDIQDQIPQAQAAAQSAEAANRRANAAYWLSIVSGLVATSATLYAILRKK